MDKKNKILVVEDNDFVRMQICRFLEDEGYEVEECMDGEEALAVMDDDTDMAIVDVRMEPMDGFEFIRSLRSDNNNTPVVLVTGDENPDLLAESGKLGVSAVLKKPVQKDRLIKTISRTLSMARN